MATIATLKKHIEKAQSELQEEIKKAQEEQPSSSKPILATLEGLSQYYLDYIAKQKEKDENEKS